MPVLTMVPEIHRHMDPEELERYSLGGISPEEAERFEDHLLLCEPCRGRLEETDLYVGSMRRASTELRRHRQKRLIPALTIAAGALLLALLLLPWNLGSQPAVAVNLVATRANAQAPAPAGRQLWLHPDLTGLAPAGSYRMEVVDRNGKQMWSGALASQEGGARIPRQHAGTYFVRVYATAGELLREYSLDIR